MVHIRALSFVYCDLFLVQVNSESMVDISHDDAVSILKATSERVVLRVEKNAISRSSQPVSTDEDEV